MQNSIQRRGAVGVESCSGWRTPPRARCQALATSDERQAGVKIVGQYRSMEKIAAQHDIAGRQAELDRPDAIGSPRGVDREMLRRSLAGCNHDEFLAAQERMGQLRDEALALIQPYLKRLIVSLDEALVTSAAEAEKQFDTEGLPIFDGKSWTLHNEGVAQALWFRRIKAERTLAEINPGSAIGAVQYFLTNEELTPFDWA